MAIPWILDFTLSMVSEDSTSRVIVLPVTVHFGQLVRHHRRVAEGDVRVLTKICIFSAICVFDVADVERREVYSEDDDGFGQWVHGPPSRAQPSARILRLVIGAGDLRFNTTPNNETVVRTSP